ncbi:ExbD/TolR family protein [Halorhodospira neutriphila]|uniref:Outer membrane transport energization protein ExbD n=1 Tax=Halorhodospira neutriphila TaxID=168379 RepID=A0ABS1E2N8_9GAMM|nr:biopolymer transporter ExbD [Halorhodospira neutriphila]MBK1725509.1 hypothetical protein [Halorhodospira neutriphila]
MRLEPPPRRRRLVSLTPLIDVVFILLVFFMIASSFVEWQAFSVSAPGRDKASEQEEEDPLRLHVEQQGYRIGDAALTAAELDERLRAVHAEDAERRLHLLVGAGVPVRRVVQALDAASAAGLSRVAVRRGEAE